MFDFIAVAEGGAQDADGFSPVSLDFEMNAADSFQDGYVYPVSAHSVKINSYKCMATFEILNNAGLADIIEQNENYPEKMGGKTRFSWTRPAFKVTRRSDGRTG
jgi:hypothetical protein